MEKISVITVVYNDCDHIRKTMDSFFSQTWEDKEYIVIDGGSVDGTAGVISEYSDRLAYWCSEKDEGLYDAMNKGISHVTGDWIIILNSGDVFYNNTTLEEMIIAKKDKECDVVYGNGIARAHSQDDYVESSEDMRLLEYCAIYRHGCSMVRTDIHKKYLFDTQKSREYGFALDYDVIYRMYHDGCRFVKIPVCVQIYLVDGVSNDWLDSLKYNRRISTQYGEKTTKKNIFFIKQWLNHILKCNALYRLLVSFVYEFILNGVVMHIPSWTLRRICMKLIGMSIGKDSFISKNTYFMVPQSFTIGDYCHVNRDCILDARGGLRIGNSVSVSHRVNIMTGSHSVNSSMFRTKYLPIIIEDYVWLGVGCTILQNVRIGKGAVVCAGAVVTRDVAPYDIVAGVPAKVIGKRSRNLEYECRWDAPFT